MIPQLLAVLIIVIVLLANAPDWFVLLVGIPMLVILVLWLLRFVADVFWFFNKEKKW